MIVNANARSAWLRGASTAALVIAGIPFLGGVEEARAACSSGADIALSADCNASLSWTGGSFTVNPGVTLTNGNPVKIGDAGVVSVGTLTNSGTISGLTGTSPGAVAVYSGSQAVAIINAQGGSIAGNWTAIDNESGAIGSITNGGQLSGSRYAILNQSGTIGSITNASTGQIIGTSDRAEGITNNGTVTGSIVNNGLIQSTSTVVNNFPGTPESAPTGIDNLVSVGSVVNNGTIIAGGSANGRGIVNSTDDELGTWSTITTVTNAGTITVDSANNIRGVNQGYAVGIENTYGIITTLNNSGTITSTGKYDSSATGEAANAYGVENYGHIGTFNNTGTLIARIASNDSSNDGVAYGIYNHGHSTLRPTSQFDVINNSGTIASDNFGIYSRGIITTLNNSGTISGQYGVVGSGAFATYGAINNTGTISGTIDGLELSTASTITNSGRISGGTAAILFDVGGNTLTLAPGSVITGLVIANGVGNAFQLGGDGAAGFDVSLIGTQYTGFDSFNKLGGSTWTLTGTSTYAGPVNVNGGTLLVNGNITSASGITVNSGGVLGGSGTVGATAIAGGALLAGGTAGALQAQGNLSFTAASTYMVQLAPTANVLTGVSGTAALGGAGVSVVPGAGLLARQYTILSAAGTLGGSRFGAASSSNPNYAVALSYNTTDVFLNLTATLGAGLALNRNQQAVAGLLNNAFNSGTLPAGLSALFSATGPVLAGQLTQASGETAAGTQQTTFAAMNLFMGALIDPFSRSGGFANTQGTTGYAEEGQGAGAYAARKSSDALAMFTKAPVASPFEQRWSVWAAGFGGSQSTDGNAQTGANSTTSRIAGTAVGADYLISPNTIAGLALAGGGTSFSVANGGSGRSDLFQAGAYLRHNEGAAYVSAALAYGWQDITTNRTVTVAGLDQLRAEFNANAWSGRLESGYRVVAPWFGGVGVTPYAAGQFTTFDLPAYAESAVTGAPAFAIAYGSKSVTDARSELGVRADKSFAVSNGVLTLRGRAAWAHDYDPDRSIAATFQALPGASFVVNGAAQASDSALTTAAIEMKWINGWSAAATFEGEFSPVSTSYAGKGLVRYIW